MRSKAFLKIMIEHEVIILKRLGTHILANKFFTVCRSLFLIISAFFMTLFYSYALFIENKVPRKLFINKICITTCFL